MTRGKYEPEDRGAHNWRTWLAVVILATLIGFGCAIGVDLADAVTGISW